MSGDEFMVNALEEAQLAYDEGEIPVGAVVVCDGVVIARGRNATEPANDPTAHAEIVAIRRACEATDRLKLPDCELHTTLCPCPMCEMVIREVGITRVFYGGGPYRWVREVKFGKVSFDPTGPVMEGPCRGLFTRKLEDMGRRDILDYEDT